MLSGLIQARWLTGSLRPNPSHGPASGRKPCSSYTPATACGCFALCARTMTALVTSPPRRNTSPLGVSQSQVRSSPSDTVFFFIFSSLVPVPGYCHRRPMAVRWRSLSGPVRHMASRIFSVTEEKNGGEGVERAEWCSGRDTATGGEVMSMGAPIKMSLSAPQSHCVWWFSQTRALTIHCQETRLRFFSFFC